MLHLLPFMLLFPIALTIGAAAPPPKSIDFTAPIMELNNQPRIECARTTPDGKKCSDHVTITVGLIAAKALSDPLAGDSKDDTASLARAELAEKIINMKTLDLSPHERDVIVQRVLKLDVPAIWKLQVVKTVDPDYNFSNIALQ